MDTATARWGDVVTVTKPETTVPEIVSALQAKTVREGSTWRAKCPACPDNVDTSSVVILRRQDGTALAHCGRGCTDADIRRAVFGGVGPETPARTVDIDTPATSATGTDQATEISVDIDAATDDTPYQVMRPLSEEEYRDLRDDIALRGVQVPVIVDTAGRIIDGHHRVRACIELGISDYARDIRDIDPDGARALAVAVNNARRQVSAEARALMMLTLRASGQSVRAIAHTLAVPKSSVARTLATVPFGTVEPPERITGIDGRNRPAVRTATGTSATVPFGTVEPPAISATGTTPHVARNSGKHEWYTPAEIVASVRVCLGVIDLDPASSAVAQAIVQASRYFTSADDGLTQAWSGRVFLNPPYARDVIGLFITKLTGHIDAGDVSEAVVLTNNATDTGWCDALWARASAVAFPTARVRFLRPDGTPGAPLQGQMLTYCGPRPEAFVQAFSGWRVWVPVPQATDEKGDITGAVAS